MYSFVSSRIVRRNLEIVVLAPSASASEPSISSLMYVLKQDVGEALVTLRAAIDGDVAEAGLPVVGGTANRSRQHCLHRYGRTG
jgi:hypothetical protein